MIWDNETINAAIAELRRRGMVITFPQETGQLLTVKEFRHKYAPAVCAAAVTYRLAHPQCPHFHGERGATGRLLRLRPTSDLIAWVNQARPRKPRSVLALMAEGERGGDEETRRAAAAPVEEAFR